MEKDVQVPRTISQLQAIGMISNFDNIKMVVIAITVVSIAMMFEELGFRRREAGEETGFVKIPSKKMPSVAPPVIEIISKANHSIFCTG